MTPPTHPTANPDWDLLLHQSDHTLDQAWDDAERLNRHHDFAHPTRATIFAETIAKPRQQAHTSPATPAATLLPAAGGGGPSQHTTPAPTQRTP